MQDWTAEQLAEVVGLTSRRIRGLCASGELEGAYKRVGAWFIPYETGQQWLDKRKEAASPASEEEEEVQA